MSMIRKEVDRQPLLVVNDKISKDVKLLVSPSNFQVGIEKKLSSLRVIGETIAYGGLSVATNTYSSGDTISHGTTIALVFGGGNVTLPSGVRDGYTLFVKDADGSASSNNISVFARGLTIDSAEVNTMLTDYESRCYLYYSNRWYVIS